MENWSPDWHLSNPVGGRSGDFPFDRLLHLLVGKFSAISSRNQGQIRYRILQRNRRRPVPPSVPSVTRGAVVLKNLRPLEWLRRRRRRSARILGALCHTREGKQQEKSKNQPWAHGCLHRGVMPECPSNPVCMFPAGRWSCLCAGAHPRVMQTETSGGQPGCPMSRVLFESERARAPFLARFSAREVGILISPASPSTRVPHLFALRKLDRNTRSTRGWSIQSGLHRGRYRLRRTQI